MNNYECTFNKHNTYIIWPKASYAMLIFTLSQNILKNSWTILDQDVATSILHAISEKAQEFKVDLIRVHGRLLPSLFS